MSQRIDKIRPFVLWDLAGRFSDPFCHGADPLVSVEEDAALVAERLVDLLGVGKYLLQSESVFTSVFECGDLAMGRDVGKDGQHYDVKSSKS